MAKSIFLIKGNICDAELRIIAKALNVSMDWLCGDSNEIVIK